MKSSNSTKKSFINLLAYCSLIIVALLMFVDRLLPVVGVTISGGWLGIFFNILRTISNLFTVIILGISAYKFTEDSKKWVKILFWIAVLVFVVATVLMWL